MAATRRGLPENPTSPYFIHPLDGPEMLLVSALLTGSNYFSWSREMLQSLSSKNKLGFVDGTLRPPTTDDEYLTAAWARGNRIVVSWILNTVSSEIRSTIGDTWTAQEIWGYLRTRFQPSTVVQIYQLRQEWATIAQGEHESVNVYFTRLTGLWDELRPRFSCECAAAVNIEEFFEQETVITFLRGLKDSFHSKRAQILSMDSLPPLNHVFALLTQEEEDLVAQGEGQSKRRRSCTYCGKPGHSTESCYKIHGYPPSWFKPRPKASIVPPTRLVERSGPSQNFQSQAPDGQSSSFQERKQNLFKAHEGVETNEEMERQYQSSSSQDVGARVTGFNSVCFLIATMLATTLAGFVYGERNDWLPGTIICLAAYLVISLHARNFQEGRAVSMMVASYFGGAYGCPHVARVMGIDRMIMVHALKFITLGFSLLWLGMGVWSSCSTLRVKILGIRKVAQRWFKRFPMWSRQS